MPFGEGYSVGRMCTDEQSKRAKEYREIKELIAQREIARKKRIREQGLVPKQYQEPTWRDEIKKRKDK